MLASIFDVLVFLWRMSLRMMSSKRLVEKYSLTANMQTMQRWWLCMRGYFQTLPLPFNYPDALCLTTHIHNCTWRKNMRNQFVLFLSFVLFHFFIFSEEKASNCWWGRHMMKRTWKTSYFPSSFIFLVSWISAISQRRPLPGRNKW